VGCTRNGISEREYKIFFDPAANILGDKSLSSDLDTMMNASQQALLLRLAASILYGLRVIEEKLQDGRSIPIISSPFCEAAGMNVIF
jgi:hypothetical protein